SAIPETATCTRRSPPPWPSRRPTPRRRRPRRKPTRPPSSRSPRPPRWRGRGTAATTTSSRRAGAGGAAACADRARSSFHLLADRVGTYCSGTLRTGGAIMKVGTVETRHLRGLAEKAFGLTKEAVGTFVGNERLTDEGKAQQRKAGEQLDALRKQAKAQAKEAKAE